MSHITVGCVDAYKDGIDKTCDSVDASIKVNALSCIILQISNAGITEVLLVHIPF